MNYKSLTFRALPFFLIIIFFGLYISTAPPSVYHGDTGETITCSHTLGIQHPPGYPLFSLAGKLASFLPAGDISYRLYVFSSFLSVLTSVIIYFIFRDMLARMSLKIKSGILALAPSLLFACGFTVWSQSITAKGGIYMLNGFFTALIFLVLYKYHPAHESSVKKRMLYLFSLLYGLSLGNHLMLQAVMLPSYLFILFSRAPSFTLKKEHALPSILFLMAGLSVYLYLPIRAQTAIINWGEPSTLRGFLKVITRHQYIRSELARSFAAPFLQAGKFTASASYEFIYAGIIFIAAGGYFLFRKNRAVFWFFSLPVISMLLVTSFYLNLKPDRLYLIENYIIPVYIPLSLMAGLGIYTVSGFIAGSSQKKAGTLTAFFIVFLVAAQVLLFYPRLNKSRYFFVHDYNRNILLSADPGSILFAVGDGVVFPLWYFKFVKHYRTDVVIIGTPLLPMNWLRDNIKRQNPNIRLPEIKNVRIGSESTGKIINFIIKANYTNFPMYFTYNKPEENALDAGLKLMPKGLVYRPVPAAHYYATDRHTAANRVMWEVYTLRGIFLPDENTADKKTKKLYLSDYSVSLNTAGIFFEEHGMYRNSLEYFTMASGIKPDDNEYVYNMGNAYYYMKNYKAAALMYKKSIEINPEYDKGWFNLGVVYYELKEYDKSLEAMKKVREINSKWPDIDAQIKRIEREAAMQR